MTRIRPDSEYREIDIVISSEALKLDPAPFSEVFAGEIFCRESDFERFLQTHDRSLLFMAFDGYAFKESEMTVVDSLSKLYRVQGQRYGCVRLSDYSLTFLPEYTSVVVLPAVTMKVNVNGLSA